MIIECIHCNYIEYIYTRTFCGIFYLVLYQCNAQVEHPKINQNKKKVNQLFQGAFELLLCESFCLEYLLEVGGIEQDATTTARRYCILLVFFGIFWYYFFRSAAVQSFELACERAGQN